MAGPGCSRTGGAMTFEEYVALAWPRLLRSAWLLTGDRHRAEVGQLTAVTGGWLDQGKSIHLSVYAQTYSHLTIERGFS